MRLPIGYDNFYKIIENQFDFVDKTLLIKEIVDDSSEVLLFTRPRRFGKTLNLSMLQHFFASNVASHETKDLFNNLKIKKLGEEYMRHQGRHPVIFLTFKDIKNDHFEGAYNAIKNLLRELYAEHREILKLDVLYEDEKKTYQSILESTAPKERIQTALKDLSHYLFRCYGTKPYILIDEYDSPIHAAVTHGYYDEIIEFIRTFFSVALKTNPYLQKAIITGILRVSKESLFSDLNNIKVHSIFSKRYSEYFGFTEEEVLELLEKSQLKHELQKVRDWYNGYVFGNTVIYNPWSIVNYIVEQGELRGYWVNTSGNALIKELIIRSGATFQSKFELLLQGETIQTLISEHIPFNQLLEAMHESVVWALLLMAGYLKATVVEQTGFTLLCDLQIPNKEIKDLYSIFIAEWLSGVNNATVFNEFMRDFLSGKLDEFEVHLRTILQQSLSVHDIKGKNAEKFYHGFMLGLFASIDAKKYKIDSNKEAGLGRYDIVIIPLDSKELGIIIEIKSVHKEDTASLKVAAMDALKQIDEKQYNTVLVQNNIKNSLHIGVAFGGKELAVAYQKAPPKSINSSLGS